MEARETSRIKFSPPLPSSLSPSTLNHPARRSMAQAQTNPIRDFFADYPAFDYDPDAPFYDEFKRMLREMRWNQAQKKAVREELRSAMVKQFNAMYGTSVDALESWQLLCSALGMKPPPTDIRTCQRKVKATHVNIVDFIEAPLSGASIVTFESELALSEYTKDTTKYFPRNDVNSGSLLKYLLRQIIFPSTPVDRPGKPARRGRIAAPPA
ncbi:hypothetical protein VTO73DRAFT_15056 [Trametes versicolor]